MVELGTVFVQNRKFYALAPKKINWKQTKTNTLFQLFENKREVGIWHHILLSSSELDKFRGKIIGYEYQWFSILEENSTHKW